MTYVIALPCVDVKDRACIDECPVDCIYEGERSLYIHPDECVDCGACEPVCPVEAIYYEDDLPEEWADYYKANVEFFDEIGSPGGAAKVGVIPKDHPRHRGAAAAGSLSARSRARAAARLPLGLAGPVRASGRARTPTASSTSRSDRRSTRRPRVIRDALAAATDAHAYPPDGRHPGSCARRSSTGSRAAAASTDLTGRERPADDRLEGARRAAAVPARRSARATSSCTRAAAYPTYAIGAALVGRRRRSPPTTRPSGRRARSSSGSTRPGNPDGRVLVGRRAARRRRPGPRARRRHRERRVLRRARLGRAVERRRRSRASSTRA